jgi:glycosyltransferase involved in cell wall biosynthesis
VKIIPLGFDLERFKTNQTEKREWFRKNYLLDDDEIAVGIIGRLVPIKNHNLFILAANAILNKTQKKVRFFIIGDGEEKQSCIELVKSIKQSYALGPDISQKCNFTFTSWIKEIDFALAGLDIVCLTSLNEGTPVSLIEAQAAGKLVVSTKVGGVENIVLENKTALLSENNDIEHYIIQLNEAINNDKLKLSAQKEGWNWVSENFSHTRLVKDTENYYLSLLNKKVNINQEKANALY